MFQASSRQTTRQSDCLHCSASAGPGLHPERAVSAGDAAVKDPGGAAADDRLGLPGDDDDSDDESCYNENDDNTSVSPSC